MPSVQNDAKPPAAERYDNFQAFTGFAIIAFAIRKKTLL